MWWCSFVLFGAFCIALTHANQDNQCTPKSCTRENSNEKPMCGSDGLTYPNRCIFERVRCLNKNLTLSKRGICKSHKPCSEWDNLNNKNTTVTIRPRCKLNNPNLYEAGQCIPEIGFCWCVTNEGLPIQYTVAKKRLENGQFYRCNKKTNHKRRSPRKSRGRLCKPRDRAIFNNNLVESFQADFGRQSDVRNANDSHVLQWKFTILDLNNDGFLDRGEYKDLKRIARKAVKPKRCAKSFTRSCDANLDQKIGRQEWQECLTRDGMDVLSQSVTDRPIEEEGTSEVRDDDPTDCIADRKTVLREENQLYVPECTPDGRYQKIQCYKSAGYCWCVHEDTGKNIPGTSVKNGTPSCDTLSPISRPMKGCPEDKKPQFLRDLVHFLHTRMSQTTNSSTSLDYIASREERVAKWSFVVFDTNKNKQLDRGEWRAFKETVAAVKGLRRCGKKLPRYCDINKDRQISLTEWLECLSVQQGNLLGANSARSGKTTLNMLRED